MLSAYVVAEHRLVLHLLLLLFRLHHYAKHKMQSFVMRVVWSVCLFVCVRMPVGHNTVSPKYAEMIDVLFGYGFVWAQGCITWGPGSPQGKGQFWGSSYSAAVDSKPYPVGCDSNAASHSQYCSNLLYLVCCHWRNPYACINNVTYKNVKSVLNC